jgi:hypothetical protein
MDWEIDQMKQPRDPGAIGPIRKPLLYLVHLWFRMKRGLTLGVRAAAFDDKGRVFLVRQSLMRFLLGLLRIGLRLDGAVEVSHRAEIGKRGDDENDEDDPPDDAAVVHVSLLDMLAKPAARAKVPGDGVREPWPVPRRSKAERKPGRAPWTTPKSTSCAAA